MSADRWLLIIGYGSIGRRHYQNARRLGWADIRLVRSAPRPGAFETPAGARVYDALDAALADGPFAAVVTNPSSLHAATATRALRAGVPVLLEKPVAASLDDARELVAAAATAGAPCSVAYCFRYHPLYRWLHSLAEGGRLGRLFHARTWWASYLPGWHPWEDFRGGYAARRELGGGVVRTLDHEMDMLRWLLGQPESVTAMAGAMGGLGLAVEDTADAIFRFPGGAQATSHVSFARRDPSRGVLLTGEAASATLDWNRGSVTVADEHGVAECREMPPGFELDHMYTEMLEEALRGFAASPPHARVPLEAGVAALEMGLGALEASRTGRCVSLGGAGHVADR